MSNSMKVVDSAILAGAVLFVGAAFSWYLAVPLALLGINAIYLRRKSVDPRYPAVPHPAPLTDDLDDPNDSRSIVNSYHRLFHRR